MIFINGSIVVTAIACAAMLPASSTAPGGFNDRVGVLGFFSHPELSNASSYHASGNYGLLDQIAAVKAKASTLSACLDRLAGDDGSRG